MDTRFSKERAQGPGAALAALPHRKVQRAGFPPHRQAPMGPPCSPHCRRRLHRPQAPWMKATCRMGRNAMKKRWCFPSRHLPPTSEYAAVSPGTPEPLLARGPADACAYICSSHSSSSKGRCTSEDAHVADPSVCDRWCHEPNLARASAHRGAASVLTSGGDP